MIGQGLHEPLSFENELDAWEYPTENAENPQNNNDSSLIEGELTVVHEVPRTDVLSETRVLEL